MLPVPRNNNYTTNALNIVPDYSALLRDALMTRNGIYFQGLLEQIPNAINYLVRLFPSIPSIALIETMLQRNELIRDLIWQRDRLPLYDIRLMSSQDIIDYLERLEQVLGSVPPDLVENIWQEWRQQPQSTKLTPDNVDLLQVFVDMSRKYIR